jgi:hypothetical protein
MPCVSCQNQVRFSRVKIQNGEASRKSLCISLAASGPQITCAILLQLRVFAFRLLQDRNIRVGVFPQRQKILVRCQRPHSRRIRVRALFRFRLQRIGPRHSQLRQHAGPAVPDDVGVVQNFLELPSSGFPLAGLQIRFAADICRVQTREIGDERDLCEFTFLAFPQAPGKRANREILRESRQD